MHNKRWAKHLELLPVIIISLVLFKFIEASNIFSQGIGFIVSLFSYFLWASAIAYFLNPCVVWIEKHTKMRRLITVLVVYTIVIILVYFFMRALIPRLVENIVDLIENIPSYYMIALDWINQTIAELEVSDTLGILPAVQAAAGTLTQATSIALNQILNGIMGGLSAGTHILTTIIFSTVISMYMLNDKERIFIGVKRLVTALAVNEGDAERIFKFGLDADDIFSRYLIGRVIDSAIIGLICYILMIIFNIPYAAMLSLIVGITNLIPYFGPFIGMVPVFIISLFSGFWIAVTALFLVFLLQQFDGFYLGPLILGGKVGLRPLWIILAITIGGRLYGVIGMFLGVPVMAVLKRLLDSYIDVKLKGKQEKVLE